MAFKKISKDEWLKLSKEEQDYLTLEFNKSVEKRRKITIFVTRGMALLLILTLIFMGFAQYKIAQSTTNTLDKYGTFGYCYLCGQYSLKTCQCNAFTPDAYPKDMGNYSRQIAQYNALPCNANLTNSLKNFYPINTSSSIS